eukprot:EG_transcript_8055
MPDYGTVRPGSEEASERAPAEARISARAGLWLCGAAWLLVAVVLTAQVHPSSRAVRATSDGTDRVVYESPDMKAVPQPKPNTKGPYRQAQLLGFNIHTAPDSSMEHGRVQKYLGKVDIDKDIQARVRILEQAMDVAYESDRWDRSPETLKVFMCPEFFFRGPAGAYKVSPILEGSLPLGTLLEQLFEQPKWKHWLFVAGTVVAAEPVDPHDRRPDARFLYFNVAPIFVGASRKRFLHFKETIATIDFLEMKDLDEISDEINVVPKPNGRIYSELPDWMDHHLNRSGFSFVKHNRFTHAGLSIGIEICADHGGAALFAQPNHAVHLHLIVSGGMSIARGPTSVPIGGPVFLVDGFGRTEVCDNLFGGGKQYAEFKDGNRIYNSGPVKWSGLFSSLRWWLSAVMDELTGLGSSPATGYSPANENFGQVKRLNALGPNWRDHIQGLFVTKPYDVLANAYSVIERELRPLFAQQARHRRRHGLEPLAMPRRPATYPTVDIYQPMLLAELEP